MSYSLVSNPAPPGEGQSVHGPPVAGRGHTALTQATRVAGCSESFYPLSLTESGKGTNDVFALLVRYHEGELDLQQVASPVCQLCSQSRSFHPCCVGASGWSSTCLLEDSPGSPLQSPSWSHPGPPVATDLQPAGNLRESSRKSHPADLFLRRGR